MPRCQVRNFGQRRTQVMELNLTADLWNALKKVIRNESDLARNTRVFFIAHLSYRISNKWFESFSLKAI